MLQGKEDGRYAGFQTKLSTRYSPGITEIEETSYGFHRTNLRF
jgi:hypothetical protein